jgi:hypothetical protein
MVALYITSHDDDGRGKAESPPRRPLHVIEVLALVQFTEREQASEMRVLNATPEENVRLVGVDTRLRLVSLTMLKDDGELRERGWGWGDNHGWAGAFETRGCQPDKHSSRRIVSTPDVARVFWKLKFFK